MSRLKKVHPSIIQSLLNDPLLPAKVREASAEKLVKWIDEIGLEDAGEIVAFASVQQLAEVFDTDLWKAKETGSDETFDPERFGIWLEILCEMGFEKASHKISEMDEDFLVMAFCELAWVVDSDWLAERCEVDRRIEKIMESKLTLEVDSFVIFGRREHSWDVFVSLLLELDSRQHSFLYRILGRCFDIFAQDMEDEDDLYDLFSSEEQLIDDVAYAREKRREEKGFVAPSTARSFLKLCEMDLSTEDLVTPKTLMRPTFQETPKTIHPGNAIANVPPGKFSRVRTIFEQNPKKHELLIEQLNYLANTLMSGWTWENEDRRPGRALEIVFEVCEEGLKSGETFKSFPRTFRIGWLSWLRNRTPA
jgi:hypothetical protein